MHYYEVLFRKSGNDICIKSEIEDPSEKIVAEFLQRDMEDAGLTVKDIEMIREISLEEAEKYYDMENEANFPVLGTAEQVQNPEELSIARDGGM